MTDANANKETVKESEKDTQSWKKLFPKLTPISDFHLYKLFYFFFVGSNGAIFPYLPVYFKQIGLLASHVGMLGGFRPLIQCLGAPFWGIIADKYRIRKGVLLLGLVAWLLKTMLILVVQPHHQTCEIITRSGNITFKETTSIYTRSLEDHQMSLNAHRKVTQRDPSFPVSPGLFRNADLKLDNERIIRGNPHKGATPNPYRIVTKIMNKNEGTKITYIRQNDKDEILWMFAMLLALVVVGEFMESPSMTLADASILDKLKESKHSYGKFRMWGSLGFSFTSFLVGYLLHKTTVLVCGQTFEEYALAFYFFAGFISLALLTVTLIDFSYEPEVKPTIDGLASLFFNFHYCSLLVVIFHMGFCHGFVVNFVNWYLDNLGASTFLMGFSMCMRHVSDVITFFSAAKLIQCIGHLNIIKISLLCYAVSLICYSFLANPWWVVPLEILQGATYASSWTACVSYLGQSAPPGTSGAVQGYRWVFIRQSYIQARQLIVLVLICLCGSMIGKLTWPGLSKQRNSSPPFY